MIYLKQIKGLKYPDEYFIKFFFKNRLHEKENLTYLEFGCGNGSNLMLPYSYGGGNRVIGIDYDKSLIEDAQYNFKLINKSDAYSQFYADDMREFSNLVKNIEADVFILPSVIYYISKNDFLLFLENIIKNNNLKKNIPFYIRVRSKKDFRYGYGESIDENRFKMPEDSIAGENNAEIEFYTEFEILDILKKYLNIRDYKLFNLDNQNEHSEKIILNSDIVIWGTIN